jgi:peroxiredoxin
VSTDHTRINLSQLSGWSVIFCYPMTGRPGRAIPDGWVSIPGAAGCTPQVCSYRDSHSVLKKMGVAIYGISTQSSDEQGEASHRLGLTYPLLSDAEFLFSTALTLPMMQVDGLKLLTRLTLILKDGVIMKCFYPVFPPDKNVEKVINWLSSLTNQ